MGAPIAANPNPLLGGFQYQQRPVDGSGVPGAPSMYNTQRMGTTTSQAVQPASWNNPYSSTAQSSLGSLTNQVQQLWQQPGMTARQKLLMQNQEAQKAAMQRTSQSDAMREQLARSGLSGSGYGVSSQMGLMRAADAGLSQALSNIEIRDAEMAAENRFRAAGLNQQATSLAGQLASDYNRQMEQQREYDASMSQRQHEYDTGQANSATQYNNELARTKYLDQWNQAAFLQQKKEEDDMFNAITQRRLNGGIQSPASSFLQRPGSTYNVFGWR